MENPILKHQTLTVLQQIEELKNWHKQQQSKLDPGMMNKINESISNVHGENSKLKREVRSLNSKVTKTDLYTNFDETPIKVASPSFNSVIENNIISKENVTDENNGNRTKPKFKFLKRGEGIARFCMGPRKASKYSPKTTLSLKLSRPSNSVENVKSHDGGGKLEQHKNTERIGEIPKLDPPDLKLNFKNWKTIFESGKADEYIERAIDNNQLEMFQPNSSIDSSTASIMEKLISVGRKHLKEKEELRVFEAMEQRVLDSSFCSSASDVARLMEKAVISTPIKKSFSIRSFPTMNSQQKQEPLILYDDEEKRVKVNDFKENHQTKVAEWTHSEIKGPSVSKPQGFENTKEDLENSLHVRFSEEVDYKSFIEISQSCNNSNQKETNNNHEFEDSEEWQEDIGEGSSCSQCSTSYSSSDEDISSDKLPTIERNPKDNKFNPSNAQSHNRRSPVEISQDSCQCLVDTNGEEIIFSPVLSAKLKELEDEIVRFRAENDKLKTIRGKLEKEHKQFQMEKKKFLKEIEDEKKNYTDQLEEEKRKLAKEKSTFEKYSKSVIKNPTKEERKEMQALRDQLSEMKQELNKKESRWGAAQARIRNEVKRLEDDNRKLRDEIAVLRKQSKHLEFLAQKKKGPNFNTTKIIHAINDHLSNINAENNVKSSIKEGNIKPNSQNDFSEIDSITLNTIRVIKEHVPNSILQGVQGTTHSNLKKTSNDQIISKNKTLEPKAHPLSNQDHLEVETNIVNNHSKNSHESEMQTPDISEMYKRQLGNEHLPDSSTEKMHKDGSLERTFPDGRKEITYKNGSVKKIDPFTGNEKTVYFNGDVKEILKNGTVKYYFSETRIWQTTLPDGLEVLDFPDGQVEKRHTNGTIEIVYPNGCKKLTYSDRSEEIFYTDGSMERIEADKRKIVSFPNGQKEIHTEECVRREYPDGTVKTLYPDGTTETVYSNGRVRLKDPHGNLVMDSGTSSNCKL